MLRRWSKITQSLPDPQRIDGLVRQQIARRLHDGPTQLVAALAMRANLAQRSTKPDDKDLAKIEDLARQTVRELRYFQFFLAPQSLAAAGLQSALEDLCTQFKSLFSLQVSLASEAELLERLSPHTQEHLFLIACEALDNVRRHAETGVASLRLFNPEKRVLMLEVKDEGRGFDTEILDTCEQSGKLGLAIVAERVKLLRGELHVDALTGVGCHLRASVPSP